MVMFAHDSKVSSLYVLFITVKQLTLHTIVQHSALPRVGPSQTTLLQRKREAYRR